VTGDGEVAVPQAFLDMPRWWTEGADWLAALPGLVRDHCAAWDLTVDGEPAHGSNAFVVPVARGGEKLVLRLAAPGDDTAGHADALRFWAGRGMVRLVDADLPASAMLLERLGASLRDVPVGEAVAVLGAMMRRLAVPAPAAAPSTDSLVRARSARLEQQWSELGRPFDAAFLTEALRVAPRLSHTDSAAAVNGDLHSEQVLRGRRESWLAVDPVLLRGDIEYDLGRVLWTRVDEMPSAASIVSHFDLAVAAADVDRDRARDWVIFRAVDYWLWGLSKGLTEDPLRCRRVIAALTV
jgi:streptomycin 6-kinase